MLFRSFYLYAISEMEVMYKGVQLRLWGAKGDKVLVGVKKGCARSVDSNEVTFYV